MAEQFYTILTTVGKAKIANAAALGEKVELTELALGDGGGSYYNPTEDQTALRNEVWRGAIGTVAVDEENPTWITIQTVVPSQHGGFMIREAGVFDNEGDLIAVGKYPETYKPAAADGSIKDLVVRMILEVSNTASVVLKVDPTVILATQQQVDAAEARAKAYTDQEVGEVSQALDAHKAAAAPHSGHETPAGAQAKADEAEAAAKAYADQKVADLAGEGRTTETVKGNADALATHLAETAPQAHFAKNIAIEDSGARFTSGDVEGALNELFTSVSDGKTVIASSITDMGQAASGSDTFAQLAAKIRDISKDATAGVGDVLAGKTFYQGGVKRTGTIPSKEAATITPGTANQTIAAGQYLSGAQTILGDPNLVPANILSGKTIFGITGTVKPVISSIETGTDRLYHCDVHSKKIYELNPNTLAVIKTVNSPGTDPRGIGGIYDRLYHSDYASSRVYELNPSTLAVISSTVTAKGFNDIGGTSKRLYGSSGVVYELNRNTLVIIKSDAKNSSGIGGILNRLYVSNVDAYVDTISEINPDTFAVIKTVTISGDPYGMGGISNRVYYTRSYITTYELNEVNPDTLAVINTVNSPSTYPHGIGGVKGGETTLVISNVLEGISNPAKIKYVDKIYDRY